MFDKLRGRTPGFLDDAQYKRYAVLAPFLPDTKEFLFQVRSQKLQRQPGEICFPGGFIESGETPAQAAVRETAEELLVSESSVELIAPLDILITPFYNMVHPYLALLRDYSGTFNTDEVAEVFTVPFSFFLEHDPLVHYNRVTTRPDDENFPHELLGTHHYPWGKARYPVLFYQFGEWVIWGMTARFVRNIVDLYRSIQ